MGVGMGWGQVPKIFFYKLNDVEIHTEEACFKPFIPLGWKCSSSTPPQMLGIV